MKPTIIIIYLLSAFIFSCTNHQENKEVLEELKKEALDLIQYSSKFSYYKEIKPDSLFSKQDIEDSTYKLVHDRSYLNLPYGEISKRKFETGLDIIPIEQLPLIPFFRDSTNNPINYSSEFLGESIYWDNFPNKNRACVVQIIDSDQGRLNPTMSKKASMHFEVRYPCEKRWLSFMFSISKAPYATDMRAYLDKDTLNNQEKKIILNYLKKVKLNMKAYLSFIKTLNTNDWEKSFILKSLPQVFNEFGKQYKMNEHYKNSPVELPKDLKKLVNQSDKNPPIYAANRVLHVLIPHTIKQSNKKELKVEWSIYMSQITPEVKGSNTSSKKDEVN